MIQPNHSHLRRLRQDDGQYENAIKEATRLKKMALGKFQRWSEGTRLQDLENESMKMVQRRSVGQLHRRFNVAKRQNEGAEAAALRLCQELDLLFRSADEVNDDKEPRLVATAAEGSVWAIELLLAAGCSVDSRSDVGWTALHWASALGHVDSVEALLAAGADAHSITQEGSTCLACAGEAGHADVVKLLVGRFGKELVMMANKNGWSCLLIASQNGHVECVRALIEAGGKELVMMANHNGVSSLLIASENGHVECVRALIEAGGREILHQRDTTLGWTPVHNAVYGEHAPLLELMDGAFDVEEARRDIEALLAQDLAIFRGVPQDALVNVRANEVDFRSGFCTVRSRGVCRAGARCYFEVTILRQDDSPQFGFAAESFQRVRGPTGDGVGDDAHSWGVDGVRHLLWHDGNASREISWQVQALSALPVVPRPCARAIRMTR